MYMYKNKNILHKYIYMYIYIQQQVRKVDDNENSVFKPDRFLTPLQVFKSYIATMANIMVVM